VLALRRLASLPQLLRLLRRPALGRPRARQLLAQLLVPEPVLLPQVVGQLLLVGKLPRALGGLAPEPLALDLELRGVRGGRPRARLRCLDARELLAQLLAALLQLLAQPLLPLRVLARLLRGRAHALRVPLQALVLVPGLLGAAQLPPEALHLGLRLLRPLPGLLEPAAGASLGLLHARLLLEQLLLALCHRLLRLPQGLAGLGLRHPHSHQLFVGLLLLVLDFAQLLAQLLAVPLQALASALAEVRLPARLALLLRHALQGLLQALRLALQGLAVALRLPADFLLGLRGPLEACLQVLALLLGAL